MTKVLIIDDNRQITSILEEYVKAEGYIAVVAADGVDGVRMFEAEKPDIILLDVMMPKMDGFEVCREIRKTSQVPVIMITARGEEFEKIMGLEIGADDYIVKPFSPGEVLARIKAILRRIHRDGKQAHTLRQGNLEINIEDYAVSIDSSPVILTKKKSSCYGPWPPTTTRFLRVTIY
jgi:DNA-binding response OmpR family regulator